MNTSLLDILNQYKAISDDFFRCPSGEKADQMRALRRAAWGIVPIILEYLLWNYQKTQNQIAQELADVSIKRDWWEQRALKYLLDGQVPPPLINPSVIEKLHRQWVKAATMLEENDTAENYQQLQLVSSRYDRIKSAYHQQRQQMSGANDLSGWSTRYLQQDVAPFSVRKSIKRIMA